LWPNLRRPPIKSDSGPILGAGIQPGATGNKTATADRLPGIAVGFEPASANFVEREILLSTRIKKSALFESEVTARFSRFT